MTGLLSSPADLAILLASAAGFGVLLAFVGVHQIARGRFDVAARLGGWGGGTGRRMAERRDPRQAIAGRFEAAVARQSFAAGIQRDLARANLRLTVSEYVLLHVAAVAVGVAIGLLSGNPLGALGLGAIGLYLPRLFVGLAQKRRMKAFGGQLADTLMLMANSLRAGYSLLQSMETVAREAPQPAAEEFGRVVREVGLGLSPEEALINLHRRMPSEDLDLMVTAINVQHEVGGNLAKIFDTLSETIRERARIQGEIQTLTAQQRLGGAVIALLPVFMAGALTMINAEYLKPLFSSEQIVCMPAWGLVVLAAAMVVLGYGAIRRIVAIEV